MQLNSKISPRPPDKFNVTKNDYLPSFIHIEATLKFTKKDFIFNKSLQNFIKMTKALVHGFGENIKNYLTTPFPYIYLHTSVFYFSHVSHAINWFYYSETTHLDFHDIIMLQRKYNFRL